MTFFFNRADERGKQQFTDQLQASASRNKKFLFEMFINSVWFSNTIHSITYVGF